MAKTTEGESKPKITSYEHKIDEACFPNYGLLEITGKISNFPP